MTGFLPGRVQKDPPRGRALPSRPLPSPTPLNRALSPGPESNRKFPRATRKIPRLGGPALARPAQRLGSFRSHLPRGPNRRPRKAPRARRLGNNLAPRNREEGVGQNCGRRLFLSILSRGFDETRNGRVCEQKFRKRRSVSKLYIVRGRR